MVMPGVITFSEKASAIISCVICRRISSWRPLELEAESYMMKWGEKYTFFQGKLSDFSWFSHAEFNLDGMEFNCVEQYVMYSKAGKVHYLYLYLHFGWISNA